MRCSSFFHNPSVQTKPPNRNHFLTYSSFLTLGIRFSQTLPHSLHTLFFKVYVVRNKNIALAALAVFSINLASFQLNASEVSCEYDSNSEWPWVDSRVCQVEVKPVILNDDGTPYCSDPRADKDGDGWGWENDASCIIDPNQPEKIVTAPALEVEQKDLIVFEQDFESGSVGPYSVDTLNEQWHTPLWHMGLIEGRAKLVQDATHGKALEVLFPANQYGSKGAVAFLNDLSFGMPFERSFEELYVSYDIKFSDNFDFVQGGKLPGLCGYNVTQAPKDGCNTGGGFPTGYDGWSARGMWRTDGVLENYVYHADQFYQYGDDEIWDVKAQPGKWHTIQHRVVLNTVGEANGIVEAWFDGVKVLSSNTMLYRKTADIGINLFYFSTFYGGADPSWAPTTDQHMYFDNFRIATTPLDDPSPSVAAKTAAPATTATSAPAEPTTGNQSIVEASRTTGTDDSTEPKIAAAETDSAETESGGGTFFPLLLGILVLLRRCSIANRY